MRSNVRCSPCKRNKWNKWHRPQWPLNWLYGRFSEVQFLVRHDAMVLMMASDALYPYWWSYCLDLWQKCQLVGMPFALRHRWVPSIAKISLFASANCVRHLGFVRMKRLYWPEDLIDTIRFNFELVLILCWLHIAFEQWHTYTTYQWNSRRSNWNRGLRIFCVACVRIIRLFHFYVKFHVNFDCWFGPSADEEITSSPLSHDFSSSNYL